MMRLLFGSKRLRTARACPGQQIVSDDGVGWSADVLHHSPSTRGHSRGYPSHAVEWWLPDCLEGSPPMIHPLSSRLAFSQFFLLLSSATSKIKLPKSLRSTRKNLRRPVSFSRPVSLSLFVCTAGCGVLPETHPSRKGRQHRGITSPTSLSLSLSLSPPPLRISATRC